MKESLETIGLTALLLVGGIIGAFLVILISIAVTAGPVVLVIWVVGKLFFN